MGYHSDASSHQTHGVIDLRRNHLSFAETLAQSIANIAPTATPALAIPLVAANAGNGTWFVYLVAMVGLVLVGLNISMFAKRYASAGSMYTYLTQSLGSTTGFISGWSLLSAYLFTAMATLLAFGIFVELVLSQIGIKVPTVIIYAIGALIIWFLAYRDIKLSSVLALVLEFISVSMISILGFIVLADNGFRLDLAQFSLHGVTISGLDLAMVLAVFSFVGFESAATLGKESRNPFRTIPRAVIVSTLIAGVFFALMSYIEVLGFGNLSSLTSSSAPMVALANRYHMNWFGILIGIGASISFFSCSLASVNAASRIMFAMGRDRIFHESVGLAHSLNNTPHVAVTISSIVNFAVPTALLGVNAMNAYGYLGTIATYGFLVAYILISIAAPTYLARKGLLKPLHIVIGVGAILFMMIPLVGSFYPVPSAPYNLFPYFYIGYLLVGAAWFRFIINRNPRSTEQIAADFDSFEDVIFDKK
ncbi:Amino acid transporter [Sulfobacillus thermosulfidooxidans DSM 9293]|uniref:Amino acid transporter n=1 Tax=Sulfobacillus thermosulfidooxidans (strain DSM 9293 / VKM B-1269 / AT-1) TaxID=929705 RepID=A0A1W1WC56_SULTA|nr:APC family permease [Sulfobacillus thermosulfidooxidans]SMC03805.1 Amino acid transporter [Sulfobacillus thermosulfidooxidans DSM 9293]